ncbi:MAG: hypothetical protein DSZ23_02730 [Thermodesulfatator sp.]|nr:MAG: hypothetical protein DSZ23_02730 [Thermodesulfatator sp.]
MLAVISWFFKTAVMISLLPLNLFLIFFRGKQQAVVSALFNLVGQALVPVAMVIIFFLVMTFSIELSLLIDKFIPALNSSMFGEYTMKVLNSFNGGEDIATFIIVLLKAFVLLNLFKCLDLII